MNSTQVLTLLSNLLCYRDQIFVTFRKISTVLFPQTSEFNARFENTPSFQILVRYHLSMCDYIS